MIFTFHKCEEFLSSCPTLSFIRYFLFEEFSQFCNVGTKCNSLTQQFIAISTTIDTWATCFDSIESSSGPWRSEDDSIESKHVAHISIVVDIRINCCVRLLHLVPILLYWHFGMENIKFSLVLKFPGMRRWDPVSFLFGGFSSRRSWLHPMSCAICGGNSGPGTGFCSRTSSFPASIIPP